jgi:Flp pilus assembly protein TadG
MRRVTQHDDRGVTTIFVVLMMPLLLLFGAFVFDGGRGLVARRQTQNAADAGALAKATDCAKGITSTDFSAYQTNGAVLANAPTCGSGTTTVSMKRNITFVFAPGGGNRDVTRSATAKWGTIGTATTVPIIISNCEFNQALLDGTTDVVFYLDDTKPQSGCSSLPGGFSQLRDPENDCAVTVSASGTAEGDPGGDIQKQVKCLTPLPHDILIAMYDAAACQASDCKGNGDYPVLGFAVLHITGYSLNGAAYGGTLGKKCPDETRGKYCIQGDFIRFVTSQGSPGPSTDFGAVQVYLSS